ncbi:MAG: F0F1 ATP synthase subunit B [Patescibacteria group bacterium]|nr:F0F1 ATP synthase subunit B [Patescibacteria group bacterium]
MDFLKDFGFQPILLFAQIVNFLILLLILKRFLYKPVLAMLEKRKQTIADSLKQAEEIEKRLAETKVEQEKLLSQASMKAQSYIDEAKEAAKEFQAKSFEETRVHMEATLIKAKETIEREREKMKSELQKELVGLVIETTSKVAGKILTVEDQKKLSQEIVKEIK